MVSDATALNSALDGLCRYYGTCLYGPRDLTEASRPALSVGAPLTAIPSPDLLMGFATFEF